MLRLRDSINGYSQWLGECCRVVCVNVVGKTWKRSLSGLLYIGFNVSSVRTLRRRPRTRSWSIGIPYWETVVAAPILKLCVVKPVPRASCRKTSSRWRVDKLVFSKVKTGSSARSACKQNILKKELRPVFQYHVLFYPDQVDHKVCAIYDHVAN